jgi:hypothetical protein
VNCLTSLVRWLRGSPKPFAEKAREAVVPSGALRVTEICCLCRGEMDRHPRGCSLCRETADETCGVCYQCWMKLPAREKLPSALVAELWGLRVGRISQLMTPGYSWCYKCKTTWQFVEGHHTPYSLGRGCFPLCEACWHETSPADRLPFYRELFERWTAGGSNDSKWADIEAAVLAGK